MRPDPEQPEVEDTSGPTPGPLVEPAWLFLLAGLALVGATLLVSARSDRAEAAHQRDLAIAVERVHLDRLGRYDTMLAALERGDRSVFEAIALDQVGRVPRGRAELRPVDQPGEVAIWQSLEPEPVARPAEPINDSALARLAGGDRSRLALLAVGAAAVLIGLLPSAARASAAE